MEFKSEPKEKGTSSNSFLKLKDGDVFMGVFRGEPHEFHVRWENSKSIPCLPSNANAKFRCRLNFVVKDAEGKYVPRIWEIGPRVYNQLKELNVDWKLDKTVVKVSRKGKGLNDTEYSITPTKAVVDDKLEALLSQVVLLDLKEGLSPQVANANAPAAVDMHEELPF